MTMTNQEINKRVAKLCGLDPVECHETGLWHLEYANGRKLGFRSGLSKDHAIRVLTPHYAESLDACREFESTLTGDDRSLYMDHIYLIVIQSNNNAVMGFENQWAMFNASPPERCKAFLRLKGQWDEN
jgi:hypothetical protein